MATSTRAVVGIGVSDFTQGVRDGKVSAATSTERDQLILQHLPLVRAIAMQIRRGLPEHVDLDDLIQAGTLGLLDAVIKNNRNQESTFGTYAKHRIRGAILDSLRKMDWASRETRRRRRRVDAVTQELSAALKRTPTEAELATELGMDLERWRLMMLDLRINLISATPAPSDQDGPTEWDFADKEENQPENLCAHNQLRRALSDAIGTLSAREQKMLRLYYDHEMPMSAIGQILGVHGSRTSQIHKAAVQKIAKVLQSAGIRSSQPC